jgi:hypothetical protein
MPAPAMTPRRQDEIEDDDGNEDISTAPFVEHPAYGRGLWKNPIQFITAATEAPIATPTSSSLGRTMAEQYLAIVFPNGQPQPKTDSYPLCGICGEPVKEADLSQFRAPSCTATRARTVCDRSNKDGPEIHVEARIRCGCAGRAGC